MEDNEGAPCAAHALSYGKKDDQVGLEEAWRCLENDGVVPGGVTLEDILDTDSSVVATREVTDNCIMQDVFGNFQGDPGSDTDTESEAANNLEVLAT